MKKFLVTCVIAVNILALGACSDKDDPEPNEEGKTGKFTVSIDKIDEGDIVIVDFAGTIPSETIWKVNGKERSNEMRIKLEAKDFKSTNTFVIETVRPIPYLIVTMALSNSGEPLNFTYKAEIDGKEVKNDKKTLSGTDNEYDTQYNY